MSFSCFIVMLAVANRSPRFGKRELIFLLLLTYVFFFVMRGFLFLLVLGMGCVILF